MNSPAKSKVFMFPGQGSQTKGMGAELFDKYSELVGYASDILGYCVQTLCLNDSHNQLGQTQFTQPALFVVNALQYHEKLLEQGTPDWLMGHSLGEYNALYAAGCFDFETGLKLVKKRGELMGRVSQGGMMAVIGLPVAEIEQVLVANGPVEIEVANINSPAQIVVSGSLTGLDKAKSLFEKAGAKACVKLNVSGAFHSVFMADSKSEFADFVNTIDFSVPKIPVVANVIAQPYVGSELRELLPEQLTGTVRWVDSIEYIRARDNAEFIEVGPGRVLTRLMPEIEKTLPQKVATPELKTEQQPAELPVFPDGYDQRFDEKIKTVTTLRKLVDGFEADKLSLCALSARQGADYRSMSYRELQQIIRTLGCGLLEMGVKKGDKVALLAENRLEWPVVYMAVASIGAIIVPLDVFFNADELTNAVSVSGVEWVFTSAIFMDYFTKIDAVCNKVRNVVCFDRHPALSDTQDAITAEHLLSNSGQLMFHYQAVLDSGRHCLQQGKDHYAVSEVHESDPLAYIFMTDNRFAVLTHRSITANIYGVHSILNESGRYVKPGEVNIATLPFHHALPAMGGFLLPFGAYIEAVVLPKFTSKLFIKTAIERKANYATMVPYMLEKVFLSLKRSGEKINGFKFFFSGGASIHKKYLKGLDEMGYKVVQGYGLTEFSPIATINPPMNNKLGSIGKAIGYSDVKIDQPDIHGNGELLVKGPSIMQGYYNLPEKTRSVIEEGWLRTGDIARVDDDGYFYITGRRKSIIVNKGGKNIYPEEIERQLEKEKYIAAARVMPRLDGRDGESPCAMLLPDYDAIRDLEVEYGRQFDGQELHQFVERKVKKITEDLASYKVPKYIEIIDDKNKLAEVVDRDFMFDDYYLTESPGETECAEPVSETSKIAAVSNSLLPQQKIHINQYFLNKLTRFLGISLSETDHNLAFDQLGLDSISLIKLKFDIEQDLDVCLPISLLGESDSLAELSENICVSESCEAVRQSILRKNEKNTEHELKEKNIFSLLENFLDSSNDLSTIYGEQLDNLYQMLVGDFAL